MLHVRTQFDRGCSHLKRKKKIHLLRLVDACVIFVFYYASYCLREECQNVALRSLQKKWKRQKQNHLLIYGCRLRACLCEIIQNLLRWHVCFPLSSPYMSDIMSYLGTQLNKQKRGAHLCLLSVSHLVRKHLSNPTLSKVLSYGTALLCRQQMAFQ